MLIVKCYFYLVFIFFKDFNQDLLQIKNFGNNIEISKFQVVRKIIVE